MKGFCLNAQGDTVIEMGDIKLAYNGELIRQKVRQVLSTNKGEWRFNPREGVPVQKILIKNPNAVKIKDYVRSAIKQVDGTLGMTNCSVFINGRTLHVDFTITGQSGTQSIELEV